MIGKKITAKKSAIHPRKGGGTEEQEIEPERQNKQVLTDEQIVEFSRAWEERSRNTSAAPRTSNGAWRMPFPSSRAVRSRRCSRSPRQPISRIACTSPSAISR